MREWDGILTFWFPEGTRLDVDAESHAGNWMWRMGGGADAEIVERFTQTTLRAIDGACDHWAGDPHGRLALIVVLDQFPRSIWRDTPAAFAQDERALALTMAGYQNGHYDALETPWYKTVYNLPLGHCEGPDHLERLEFADRLARRILAESPAHLRDGYAFAATQPAAVRHVIETFGRHPHRNAALGRASTPAEEAYVAKGDFPHLRRPQSA